MGQFADCFHFTHLLQVSLVTTLKMVLILSFAKNWEDHYVLNAV